MKSNLTDEQIYPVLGVCHNVGRLAFIERHLHSINLYLQNTAGVPNKNVAEFVQQLVGIVYTNSMFKIEQS